MRWKENSVEVRFRRDAPKISPNEIFDFISTVLKIDPLKDLKCLQQELQRRVISLTMSTEEKCGEVCRLDNGELLFTHANGDQTPVSLTMAGLSNTTVRVHDLPYGMPHQVVVAQLRNFGIPTSPMSFELWPCNGKTTPLSNGSRVVKINLDKHIPSYVMIGGTRAVVQYPGQPRTCARCGLTGHFVRDCTAGPPKKTFASAASGRHVNGLDVVVGDGEVPEPLLASHTSLVADDTPDLSVRSGGNTPPLADRVELSASAPSSVNRGVTPRDVASPAAMSSGGSGKSSGNAREPETRPPGSADGSVVERESGNPEGRVQSPVGPNSEPLRSAWELLKDQARVQLPPPEKGISQGEEEEAGSTPVVGSGASGGEGSNSVFREMERSLSLNLETKIGEWEMNSPDTEVSWASACSTPIPAEGNKFFEPREKKSGKEEKRGQTVMPRISTRWTVKQAIDKAMRTGNVELMKASISKAAKRGRNSPDQDSGKKKPNAEARRTENSKGRKKQF